MTKLRGHALRERLLEEQREWITKCGGTLEGYIANYHGVHGRTVENATAIFNADMAELERREMAELERREKQLAGKRPPA